MNEDTVGIDETTELKAKIEQLEKERQVLLTAFLELYGAVETLANHAQRVFQALGIKRIIP